MLVLGSVSQKEMNHLNQPNFQGLLLLVSGSVNQNHQLLLFELKCKEISVVFVCVCFFCW